MNRFESESEDRVLPVELLESSDGVRLPLYEMSPPAGRPLVVAHATGFNARTYLAITDRLPEFWCFGADLRGHGDANSPDCGFAWRGFGEDVQRVAAALVADDRVPDPLYGFGHSMGGAALLMAEIEHPGTFEALFLFEPIVAPPRVRDRIRQIEGESPMAAAARRRRSHFESRSSAYDNFSSKEPMRRFHPEALDAYVRYGFREDGAGGIVLKLSGPEEAEVYNLSTGHEIFGRLSEVRCPVMVAYGLSPDAGPAGWAPDIAHQLAAGLAHEMPTVGHLGPLEDPALFASTIREFFASCS